MVSQITVPSNPQRFTRQDARNLITDLHPDCPDLWTNTTVVDLVRHALAVGAGVQEIAAAIPVELPEPAPLIRVIATDGVAHDWTCARCGVDRWELHQINASAGWMSDEQKLCWSGRCAAKGEQA